MTRDSETLPVAEDFWADLRLSTQARIGLGRAGDALPTSRVLEFKAAHAAARDAVHLPLDSASFAAKVAEVGLGDPAVVSSRASSRSEYLRRPDLGRTPESLDGIEAVTADLGFVLADGLSPRALEEHGIGLLTALKDALSAYSMAAPVVATQARVALGDHIGEAMGVQTLVVIIGERPGLSVASSLGIYLTHLPKPGRSDAERNCISNIHPPDGQSYANAARIAAGLISGARQLGKSGVALKDTSAAEALGS